MRTRIVQHHIEMPNVKDLSKAEPAYFVVADAVEVKDRSADGKVRRDKPGVQTLTVSAVEPELLERKVEVCGRKRLAPFSVKIFTAPPRV